MNRDAIIKELLRTEAWAAGLQEQCYRTRKLIEKEGGVSTLAKDQQVLSDRQLAELSARRKLRMKKSA